MHLRAVIPDPLGNLPDLAPQRSGPPLDREQILLPLTMRERMLVIAIMAGLSDDTQDENEWQGRLLARLGQAVKQATGVGVADAAWTHG